MNSRTITGIWTDVYLGKEDQGTARIKVQLVSGETGEIISDSLPLPVIVIDGPTILDERSNTYQLLGNVIKELKIMNLHLAKITGYEIDRMEIEDWKS